MTDYGDITLVNIDTKRTYSTALMVQLMRGRTDGDWGVQQANRWCTLPMETWWAFGLLQMWNSY